MSSHLSKTDTHLYGAARPQKNKPITTSSSSTLAFSSTLSSLLSSTPIDSTTTSRARARPSRNKSDIFTSHNRNTQKRALRDLEDGAPSSDATGAKVGKQDLGGVDAGVLARSRRKLEEKARRYAEMKKGGYVAEDGEPEGLIEWDRKWAESGERAGASPSDDDEEGATGWAAATAAGADPSEVVEYEDEYGRLRTGTAAERARMERKKRHALLGAEELERMSARPRMPENLIFGPAVQAAAFNPDEESTARMEALSRKRDRSATPPPATHYDAATEIRSKGVGFYAFSREEGRRKEEMEGLEGERRRTEGVREEREGRRAKRRGEVEERRRKIAEMRGKKMADSFLEGLETEVTKGDDGREDA